MPKNSRKDGRGVEGHQAYVKEMMRHGENMFRLEHEFGTMRDRDIYPVALRFVDKSSDAAEWLLVLSVDTDAGAKVGFCSGGSFAEALGSLVNRLANNSMRWKDDEYRNK